MKNKIILIIILIIALAVRLGIGVFLGFNAPPDQAACGADTVEFEYMAWSASQGHGFRLYDGGELSAFRAPGYPLMLSVVYKIFGRHFWLNRLMLSLVGVATCWLLYLLVVRMRLGYVTGLVAAGITALLPLQFYWCGHFMGESVSSFFNVMICLLLVIAYEKKSLVIYFLSGLVIGFSALVRAACMLIPIMYGLLMLLSKRIQFKRLVLVCIIIVFGVFLAVIPWIVRNKLVLDRVVFVSTNGGSTFWGANNDLVSSLGENWGDWISTTTVDRERKENEVWVLSNESDQDKMEWKIGKEYVRNNLSKMPLLEAGKFWQLLRLFPKSNNRIYVLVAGLGWMFLFPLMVVGMWYVWRDKVNRYMFITVNTQILTLLVTVAIFYGSERFRMPYEPLLAIYAAVAVVKIKEKIYEALAKLPAGTF